MPEYVNNRKAIDEAPEFVNVTFRNGTTAQHVYTITDKVLGVAVWDNKPVAAGDDTGQLQLVANENHHGEVTYTHTGGVPTSRTDLNDGDTVDMD
jgi:hypothetical protein